MQSSKHQKFKKIFKFKIIADLQKLFDQNMKISLNKLKNVN